MGNFCPEHQRIQLSWHFSWNSIIRSISLGLAFWFIRYLFTNILHKRSNVTTGKSMKSNIMNTREATEGRIKNGEVRLQASGACWGRQRYYLGAQSGAVGARAAWREEGEDIGQLLHTFAPKLPSAGESDRIIIVSPSGLGQNGGRYREKQIQGENALLPSLSLFLTFTNMPNFCFNKMVFKIC